MSEYHYTPNDVRLLRLLDKTKESFVQGLFLMMYVKGKTMNDVEKDTGISRQTLSKWRKGGNVMHVNVQKISEVYGIDAIELYDTEMYMIGEIARAGKSVESASLKQLYSELVYLGFEKSKELKYKP